MHYIKKGSPGLSTSSNINLFPFTGIAFVCLIKREYTEQYCQMSNMYLSYFPCHMMLIDGIFWGMIVGLLAGLNA